MKNLVTIAIISLFFGLFGLCGSETSSSPEEVVNSADSASNEVAMSAEEQKKLNTFMSNFSEAFVDAFEKGTISDASLISFGVTHNLINNEKRFEKEGDYELKIKKEYIDEAVKKYFGLSVKEHQTVEGIAYNNGYYSFAEASGEAITFSQVEKLIDNKDNTFTAFVNIYTADSGFAGDVNAKPEVWANDAESVPELTSKMRATIQKNADGNFILIDYLEAK